MSSPQIEDGYTKIANEILDALCHVNLSPKEWRLLICVFRKTYGFKKKIDNISLSQFQKATKLTRAQVCKGLNKLTKKNMLGSIRTDTEISNKYYFKKKYLDWQVVSEPIPSISLFKKVVSEPIHTKETITKDITTTKELGKFQKPTLTEVEDYIKEKKYKVNATRFYAHYESNGWKVGKNSMKNWKMSVTYWETNEKGKQYAKNKYVPRKDNGGYSENNITSGREFENTADSWKR